jgi:hypothetical protein
LLVQVFDALTTFKFKTFLGQAIVPLSASAADGKSAWYRLHGRGRERDALKLPAPDLFDAFGQLSQRIFGGSPEKATVRAAMLDSVAEEEAPAAVEEEHAPEESAESADAVQLVAASITDVSSCTGGVDSMSATALVEAAPATTAFAPATEPPAVGTATRPSTALVVASYAGMPFGLMAFIFVSETGLRLVLGVVVVSAAVLLLRGFHLRDESHHLDWALGMVSGFLSTSTSTNGPPLVFLMQARRLDPATFRATINAVFAVVNLGALALFAFAGKVNANNLSGVAVALPALGIAIAVGYSVRQHVTQERFNTLVITLLFLSAISVIVSAFTH